MAKKTIPLVKPTGSTGDGNIKVPGGPLVLDLGEFDDIFGPMESDSPRGAPLGEFWKGMKDSFSDRFRARDVVRNFLRSAAPDGISNLMGFADEAMSASRDIKDSLERSNASDLQYIAKKAQALLPKLQDYAPEGLYNDISQGLENKIDEYDYTIQSQRDQTAIRRAAQSVQDENEIKAALDNIALTERLNHNRSEQAAQMRHKQGRAESSIRDLLQTKRFDFVAKSMGMAVDGIQRIAGYNEQVNYGFQRKGLELQFRSYMGIKELVKLQEANLELNARAYNAMILNTSMTDAQKANTKGLGQMQGVGKQRQGFLGRAVSSAANKTLSGFLGNYGGDAQGRLTGDLSQKLSMLVMASKMGEGGPSLWDNKYKMAGQFAGDYAGDFILNELIPMLGREARPGLTNMSNKHAGGKHNQIGYYLDNMPAFLQEFVNNGQNQHGMKGKIRDLIAPYVPQFGLNDRTNGSNYQTIDQAAQFNQMTQRTIVDAMPGYLARMLQELRMIRTGRDDVAREVFDITTGKFTVESNAHDNIQARIIPKSAVRAASSTINDALNTMDAEGQLSPQARKALSERMLRDASTNRRFDPEAYIKSRGYAKDMPPEVAAELEQFFRGKFEFDEHGSMTDSKDNHKLRQEFSQAFLDIRSISRDPIKEIQRMINTGHTEPLRAIGIIITEDNVDKINYPRIWEILRSGVSNGNPFAPGGDGNDPSRDDMSGTNGHKEFIGPAWPGAEKAWAMNKMKRFRSRYAPEEQKARDEMAKQLKTMRGRFGSAADAVRGGFQGMTEHGMPGFGMPGSAGFSASFGNMQSGYDQFVNKASDVVDDIKNKGAARVEEKITDLYSQFDKNYPALRAKDLVSGELIDVNTKKIITKISDITGKVINLAGDVILSDNEVAAGLMNPSGEIVVKVVSDMASKINAAVAKHVPGYSSAESTKVEQDPEAEEALNSQDWTLGPGEEPVITSRKMNSGEYYDAAGKVLNSIKDIAGDVYDKTGNLIITAKDFANGLWSRRTGKRYRPTKGFSRLLKMGKLAGKYSGKTSSSMALGALKFTGKAALGIASKVFNFIADNQNAYLPGEAIPVITRRAVQNGEYYDEKGNVVENFIKVYGPLYNAQGELVIPPEQYKQLKNYDGSKHNLAKNQRIFGKYIMRPLRTVRNAYARASLRYWKALGRGSAKAGSWMGKKTLGGFAKTGDAIFNRMFEHVEDPNAKAQIDATLMASNQQTNVLSSILQELLDRKPKEDRAGSWQALEKRKASGLPGTSNKKGDSEDDQKDGLFKRGLKGLAGMLGLGKKGKDEEEEDDGFGLSDLADAADIGDAVGDARERRGRRKGKLGKSGGAGKGRLASLGSNIAKSRVGQAVATSVVGRGLMMAGTALAGVLSAPVLIGAAAVGAVAAAGYYGYKRYSAISGEFRELRFAQYGVSKPVDKGFIDSVMDMDMFSLGGDKMKILELEALIEKYTDKNTATPSFSINGAGGKDILSIMGIDLDREDDVTAFARWLEKRFKPVYLAWQAALFKLGKPDVKIDEFDDKFPNELKADFLEIIKFPYSGATPYASLDNPFSSTYPLADNTSEIETMFAELTEKYNKERKKKDDKAEVAKAPSDVTKQGATDATKAAAAAGAAATGVSAAKALAEVGKNDEAAKAAILNSPIAAKAAIAGSMSGTIQNLNQRIGSTLTGLQSIRMRAYGLQVLGLADVKALLALEAVYAKDLTVSPYSVDYNGDEDAFLKDAGQILGKDITVGSMDRPKLVNWLKDRFGPTFRAYYGAAVNAQPAALLANMETKLTASDRVSVGKAMLGAINGDGRAIWEMPSLFNITGNPQDLKLMADADQKHLEDLADKEVASSPTQKSSDQMAGKNAADQGGSFADKAMATIKDTWNNATETVSSAWNRAKDTVGDGVASAKIAVGMGPDYGEGGATGGAIQSAGTAGTVMAGNGGKWESIPMPSSSGSAKAAKPTLKAIADMTGVPCDWLMAIAGIESGFRYDIKSSTSSATGWYQFINDTWDSVYKKYGPKYGCPADPSNTRAVRKEPRINGLMGAEFIKANYEGLKKGLGRSNLTDTDVYMAHFLGLGGALKFFRADPNAMAYKIFSKEYSANMPLFFVDGKPSSPRTISQVYKLFQSKLEKFWATTGKGLREGGATVPGAPVEAQPVGGAQVPAKSEEELTKDRLAADAKDKAGVSAQADPGAPAGPGTENQSSASTSQPTVSSIAKDTGPMPGAPATGGGGSAAGAGSSSVSDTGTSSGGNAVDEQRNAILAQAQSQNTRRENEVRRDQAKAGEVNDVQNKQLGELVEIRRLMSDLIGAVKEGGIGKGNSAGGSNGGDRDNMTPSPIQNRQAAQRSSALTLR